MELRRFQTDLIEISREKTIRNDVNFIDFQNDFNVESYYSFNDLFYLPKSEKVNLDEIEDDFPYVEIGNATKDGDVEPVILNLNHRNIEDGDYYKKIDKGDITKARVGEILLSKVRPNLKKYIYIDESKERYYYTSAFIRLEPKRLSKIVYYSLRTLFFKNIVAISRRGKGYPTLKEADLTNIKFDKVKLDKLFDKENLVNREIEKRENIISQLRAEIKSPQAVIDEVFIREFNLNMKKFNELSKIKSYESSLSSFSNNADIRFSVNFHNLAGAFVLDELKKLTSKKIKHFTSEPIVLGASISPADFDENGDYHYISMATVKNYKFEFDESQLVSNKYANSNLNKSVKKDDIIMTRSGVAIGKFALLEEEANGIFADFTMRIRLTNYNPLFAYYYFRTTYLQHLIHTNKKGLQNKNIFPNQIREFPLIDIPLQRQEKIVAEIKKALNLQENIKATISTERLKIDEIIENAAS